MSRRSMMVVAVAGAALGAGLLGQGLRHPAGSFSAPIDVGDIQAHVAAGIPDLGVPAAAPATNAAQAALAQNSLSRLEQPGYLLTSSAAAALADVRVTVADAIMLQQLRAQIVAPAPAPGLSAAALTDLVSLVRQAQVSLAGFGTQANSLKPLDTATVAQAQSEVRAAQLGLVEAVRGRDERLIAAGVSPVAAIAEPGNAPTSPLVPGTVAAARVVDPALVSDAQARLAVAQQQLELLLAEVRVAEKAVSNALAATPLPPRDERFAEARAAVDRTQKDADAANQPVFSAVVASARSAAATRSAPVARDQAAPAAAVAEKPDTQRIADTKANLESAKAALAVLEQQAAYAADPESQPNVVQARAGLAAVLAPPNPSRVADARTVVATIEGQVASLLRQGSSMPTTSASASPKPALAAPVRPAGTDAVSTRAGPSSQAAAAPPEALLRPSAPVDSVTRAEQRLTAAQSRLRDLVSPPTPTIASDGTVPVLSAAPGNPTAQGTTVTQPTAEILAAQVGLASAGQVSANDLTAIQVGLRARYVVDAVLKSEQLHPSALPIGPASALVRSGGVGAPGGLAWPVIGTITQPFGVPELGLGSPHTGLDIGIAVGTPVLASASGVVNFAGGDPGTSYGYYTIVDHGAGVTTLYAHLALPPLLHKGQFLPLGGLVGLSGSTGFSTGPHLHFELRLNGAPVDPLRVLLSGSGR